MSAIDDWELMDLMQHEVIDLLQENGFSAARLQFAVDTEQTTVAPSTLKGWSSVAKSLAE